jgi:hypothetical protein
VFEIAKQSSRQTSQRPGWLTIRPWNILVLPRTLCAGCIAGRHAVESAARLPYEQP